MEKQTAIEWLIKQWPILESQVPSYIINQAKEMEKEQIINSFNDGYRSGHFDDGKLGSKYHEEYY